MFVAGCKLEADERLWWSLSLDVYAAVYSLKHKLMLEFSDTARRMKQAISKVTSVGALPDVLTGQWVSMGLAPNDAFLATQGHLWS